MQSAGTALTSAPASTMASKAIAALVSASASLWLGSAVATVSTSAFTALKSTCDVHAGPVVQAANGDSAEAHELAANRCYLGERHCHRDPPECR